MRVCFPYVAELHQVFHSLPIAAELALRHPSIEVRVACTTNLHIAEMKGAGSISASRTRVRSIRR